MHLSSKVEKAKILKLKAIAKSTFIPVLVINIKVIKTIARFFKVLGKSLNNNFFYYSSNMCLNLCHVLSYSNNFSLYFFLLKFNLASSDILTIVAKIEFFEIF